MRRARIPLSIHTSANWTPTRRSELGHPRFIDEVACHFPVLKIIMSHASYPWVLEACLVARKHPNLFLELGAHRPRYLAAPGAGWEALMRFGQTTIADKVLFGTGAFLLNRRTPSSAPTPAHSRSSPRCWRAGCGTTPIRFSVSDWVRRASIEEPSSVDSNSSVRLV